MQSNRKCKTCRTRRIKCDGAEPICNKCIKAQRTCVPLEDTESHAFTIHIENQYASGEEQRPRGPRSSLTPLQPTLQLRTRAVAYFMQNHFQMFEDMPDVSMTWAECFHEWGAAGNRSDMVDLGLSSLSLAVFAKAQSWKPAAMEGCGLYLQLLQAMQTRIPRIHRGDLSQNEIDECLLTIHFMARYESLVQSQSEDGDEKMALQSMKVWFHFDGAVAILKSWSNSRQEHKTPTSAIKLTRRTIIRTNLLREQRIAEWLAHGSSFGEFGTSQQFDSIVGNIINLHQEYLALKQKSANQDISTFDIETLFQTSYEIERDILDWPSKLPYRYAFTESDSLRSSNTPVDPFTLSPTLICAKPGYSLLWNEYHSMGMLLINTRLKIINLVSPENRHPEHEAAVEPSIYQFNSWTEKLINMIPFSLGKIPELSSTAGKPEAIPEGEVFKPYKANLAVWSIAIASSLEMLDPERREFFRRHLEKMAAASSECLIGYVLSGYWMVL
ncbi:unnamed protein product [Periconia digitata]|uniref:Zn(2)-C6 fungal-type domain-containing protein n=1 Tax=Periconia digitata TaxID=1303443 RepID=A0A9W4UDC2_9PLEO|nr:unnamed protein product [Periconia digitata]